jgi:hypothetical protein
MTTLCAVCGNDSEGGTYEVSPGVVIPVCFNCYAIGEEPPLVAYLIEHYNGKGVLMSKKKITDADFPIAIPTEIAICPICGANLYVQQIDCCWEDNGKIMEEGIVFGCSTEPQMQAEGWWPWHWKHYGTPYVDWMPLYHPITKWFNANYRYSSEEKKNEQKG